MKLEESNYDSSVTNVGDVEGAAVNAAQAWSTFTGTMPMAVYNVSEHYTTTDYGPYWDSYDQHDTFFCKMTMQTGHKGAPTFHNLFEADVSAWSWQPCTGFNAYSHLLCSTPLPPGEISDLGQTADASGRTFAFLGNNVTIDVIPQTPAQSITYNVNNPPGEYQPVIQANGITLDPSKINATFCVGQQIQFTVAFSPALRYSNAICTWTLPDKFVNSWSANPPGSTIYTNDPTYLTTTNGPCVCWYVNGSGGTVSVHANMILTDGKIIPISAVGQFAIQRPSVSMNQVQEPRFFTITSNTFGGATVKLGTPGGANVMAYAVDYDIGTPGLGQITQTCQLQFNPGSAKWNFSDWRCDGSTNYEGPQTMQPGAGSITLGFQDGPQNGTYFSTSSIEVKGNFTDYIMFQPTNTPGGIFVTLGVVTWNIDGLITNMPTGWVFGTTNTPDPVGPDNSDQFPIYTQPQ